MSLTIAPAQIVEESDSPLLVAPDSWPRHPLGAVATILNGFAFKSKQFVSDGGKPLVRIRDIFNDRTAVGYVGQYDDRYIVHPGELLIGMDGDFNCAVWRGPDALLNQRVCKITPDPEQLDHDFLTCILPGYLEAIHDVTSSTTVTHLSSRDIAQIPIPVPSLTDQQMLAQLFGTAKSKQQSSTTHLQAACRTVKRFRQAVLAAACSGRLTEDWRHAHPYMQSVEHAVTELASSKRSRKPTDQQLGFALPELPESYIAGTVEDAAILVEYGTSQRADASADEGVPILRMGNIQDGHLDLTELKFSKMDKAIERLLLNDGDLLFNRTNSPELVGKSAVYHSRESMSFASYLIRVRFAPDICDPDFANYWINSAWGRAWAQLVKTDGVSQSNINGTKLSSMPIPLPPIEEQQEIVRRASALLSMADGLLMRIKDANRAVARSSDALLAKALRGEYPLEKALSPTA